MSAPPAIDPLEMADRLAAEISGVGAEPGCIASLVRAIDGLAYAIHFAAANAASGAETMPEPPRLDYDQAYEAIRRRYPTLGRYWLALHPVMQEGTEGELAVGDAVDDLADILIELTDVRWLNQHARRVDALATLRTRYETHLWMHVHSLRQYLEEVKRDD